MTKQGLISFCILGLMFSSCRKIIDVELDQAEAEVVIEASLRDGAQNFTVRVSKTGAYFGTSSNPTLDNAVISLSDDQGNIFPVTSIGNGLYQTPVTGVSNRLYTLNVSLDGINYTAQSYMLPPITLDSLSQEYTGVSTINPDPFYTVFMRFQEPAGIENHYRFVSHVNGIETPLNDNLMVLDDKIFDGGYAKLPVFNMSFEPGDSVLIELRHLNQDGFAYYNSLADILFDDGGASAAPGNPISNWDQDALGHFTAYSVDTASIVLPN